MMHGREFLEVSAYLKGLESEASARTRVGRAYYAAFLEARAYCESVLGYQRTMTGREHSDVPKLLKSFDSDIAANLAFLRQLRPRVCLQRDDPLKE